jgi:hypothetical protein
MCATPMHRRATGGIGDKRIDLNEGDARAERRRVILGRTAPPVLNRRGSAAVTRDASGAADGNSTSTLCAVRSNRRQDRGTRNNDSRA